jgi:hypothetical protein
VELAEGTIRVVSLSLAALFVLAAAHKARVLVAGTANQEPLMQLGAFRRRHAPSILAAAAAIEMGAAALLLVEAKLGLAVTLLLLAPYTWELRRLEGEQPCNCLGSSLGATRSIAVRRNVVLSILAACALAPLILGWVGVASISQATVGATLLALAVVLPIGPLAEFVEPTTKAHLRGSGSRKARRGGRVAT